MSSPKIYQVANLQSSLSDRVLKAGDTMTGNLNVAATLITQNVIPDANVTYDLGTSTARFKDLWLSNSTIYLGEASISAQGGNVSFGNAEIQLSNVSTKLNVTNDLFVSGNVGIGTATPQGKLEVRGDIYFGSNGNQRIIQTAGEIDGEDINLINAQGSLWQKLTILDSGDENNGGLRYSSSNNAGSSYTNHFQILNSGRVGIGTNDPIGKLHVSSGISGNAIVIIEADTDNDNENDVPKLWFRADGGINEAAIQKSDNTLDIISNVDTGGGINFLTGTTNNTGTTDPITNATSRMFITSSGNIGIGTIAPTSKLQISDSSSPPQVRLHFNGSASSGNKGSLIFTHNRNSDGTEEFLGYIQGVAEDNQSSGGLRFVSRNNADVETFRITSAGNVGIGTTNPTNCKVAIQADWVAGHSTLKIFPTTSMASGGGGGLGVFDSDGITRLAYIFANQSAMEIWCQQNTPINFGTNNEQRMQIAAGGNVGIGTSSPSEKLHIVGGNLGFFPVGGVYPKIGIIDSGMDCYLEITDENPTVLGVTHGGEFKFFGDKVLSQSYLQGGSLYLENSLRFRRFAVTEITDSKGTSAIGGTANPKIVDSSLAYGTYLVSAYIQYRGTAPSGDPDQTCIRLIKGGTEICRACILDQDSAYASFEDFASFAVMVDVDGSTNITVDMFTTDPGDPGGADVNYQVNITRLGY